ncbi:actin-binding FH2 [Saitoella complicata NRRL Y-17804]|uniref:actin-binding FH2 n=1 Tax=Saitoella complicata (strain BCRC 22490 / CBS 7301 / JCM 7358 / NBRC 10748 / NRRL Y-17804) TaxID=698492 RepID=UPI000867D179|nr:actin-binding FH2 [Saitoella complicata NRRL Y-17804]ODQ51929.1 actin-binding FH2 [Saitoella complicata NRRL Y-17804]
MFSELLERRNMPPSNRDQMMAQPMETKWKLLQNDMSMNGSGDAKKRESGSKKNKEFERGEAGSARYFVQRILTNQITMKEFQSLGVSLRTESMSWLRAFIDNQGQVALTKVLSQINHRNTKRDDDIAREYEIIKCLKSLLNNQYGAEDAVRHQSCVYAITSSIGSNYLPTRKLVAEVLTFLCHWDKPNGHQRVLTGFDQMKERDNEIGRFDAWMRQLEVSIDGRGKFGSLVGASEEMRKGGLGIDSILMEYSLANLFLINAIVMGAEDVRTRMLIRSQMKSYGLQRILNKMREFKYDLVERQIEAYENDEQLDTEEVGAEEEEDAVEVNDINNPYELVHGIMQKAQGKSAEQFFLNALQHMFLVRGEDEERARLFQLADSVMGYMFHSGRNLVNDPLKGINIGIGLVLDRMKTDEEVRQAYEESRRARARAEQAEAERDAMEREVALGADGLVALLKKENEELHEVLESQRRRNETLQEELDQTKQKYQDLLQTSEVETRELYLMVKQNPAVRDLLSADRKALTDKLERQLQRTMTVAKLEGRMWKQDSNMSAKLMHLRNKMDMNGLDKVQGDARDLHDRLGEESSDEDDGGSNQGQDQQLSPTSPGYGRERTPIPSFQRFGPGEEPPASPMDEETLAIYEKPRIMQFRRPKPMGARKANFLLCDQANRHSRAGSVDESGSVNGDEDEPSGHTRKVSVAERAEQMGPLLSGPLAAQPSADADTGSAPPAPAPAPPPPPPPAPPMPPTLDGSRAVTYERGTKLKPMHWDKLDAGLEYTLWANHKLDANELCIHLRKRGLLQEFIDSAFTARQAKSLAALGKKAKKEEKHILDDSLLQQVEISFRTFADVAADDIVKMIMRCDKAVMDNTTLLEFMSNPKRVEFSLKLNNEMEKYLSKNGVPPAKNPDELPKWDRVYFELFFKCRHYWTARMNALEVARNFETDYTRHVEKLRVIDSAAHGMKTSQALVEFMNVILGLGNYMNDMRKQAAGFKLSSLSRLVFTKDEKNVRSFLHAIQWIFEKEWPQVQQRWLDDTKDVAEAAKLDVNAVKQDAEAYYTRIFNLKASLERGALSDHSVFHEDDEVTRVVTPLLKKALDKASMMQDYVSATTLSLDRVMKYFGEDPSDALGRKLFFPGFNAFINEYKKARMENMEFASQERLSQSRKKVLDSSAEASPVSEKASDEKDVMDKLLENLRNTRPTRTSKARGAAGGKGLRRTTSGRHMRAVSGSAAPDTVDRSLLTMTPSASLSALSATVEAADDISQRARSMLSGLREERVSGSDRPASIREENDDDADDEKGTALTAVDTIIAKAGVSFVEGKEDEGEAGAEGGALDAAELLKRLQMGD